MTVNLCKARIVRFIDVRWDGANTDEDSYGPTHADYEGAAITEVECDDDFESAAIEAAGYIRRDGLTFTATGAGWAADPNGSQCVDYSTDERSDVTAHLEGAWTLAERNIIADLVG